MATKDLHHCAQLLSQMLDKDTGSVNSRGGIQAKQATASSALHSAKPFITTGRLSRKVSASKLTKSRTSKFSGKPKATSSVLKQAKTSDKESERVFDDGVSSLSNEFLVSQGSQQKREDLKKSISRFLADQDSKVMNATAQKGFRIPTADREPSSKSKGGRMSPPAPVLFNHRLACSTPTETSKRLVELGNTLILNGSTGTQILNATDEVRAMLQPVKNGPSLKLVHANIDIVPNSCATEVSENCLGFAAPLSSTRKVENLGREGYAGDVQIKQMFKVPNKHRGLVGSQKKSVNNASDITVKRVAVENPQSSTGVGNSVHNIRVGNSLHSVGVGNSMCNVGVGNSMHSVGVGNSMHSVGVGNSMHSVGVGNSMHSVGVGNSMHSVGAGYSMHSTDDGEPTHSIGNSVCKSHSTEESSVKCSGKFEKLDNSQFDRKHLNGSYSPLVIKRKSGSMVDLSSDRTGTILQSNSSLNGLTMMNLHPTKDSSSGMEERKKESVSHRSSLTVGSGDHDFDTRGSDFDVKVTGQENSNTTRLVMLLRQVKDVISEKQNCRISRLIKEIQDVMSNTPDGCAIAPSTDIETDLALQPLRSENAQLRRRVRILNQQLREKEKLLEAVEKPEPSFQVLHLSMLNQHLEKQLGNLKEEIDDLRRKNEDLHDEFDKVVHEKAEMLQVIAKKDDDHVKSLQEKMREIGRVQAEAEDMWNERQMEVEQLRKQIKNLQFDVTQKDKEIEQAQNLIRGLQASMSRLVHDLQSSRLYPVTKNSGNLNETLKSVKHFIGLNLNNTHSGVDSLSNSCVTIEQHGELQCSCIRNTTPKLLNFSGEMQKNTPSNSTQMKNSVSSESTKNHSRIIKEPNTRKIEESNTRRIEEWKRQAEAAWPSTGITVKALLNPEAGQALYNSACANPDDFDSFKSFSDVEKDHDSTLVEVHDQGKVEFKVAQNGPDLSRHSITDYFCKYRSSNTFNIKPDHDRKLTCTSSPCTHKSGTYSGSYHDQSFPDSQAEDEAISIHMSDFNNLSDRQHSSEIDSDLSDLEGNAVTRKKDPEAREKQSLALNLPIAEPRDNKQGLDLTSLSIAEARDNKQSLGLTSLHMNEASGQNLELDLTSLQIAETESTGTTCTLSSLGTISSVDDQAFKKSLASLDANIALIQENLRCDLALKYPTLAKSS